MSDRPRRATICNINSSKNTPDRTSAHCLCMSFVIYTHIFSVLIHLLLCHNYPLSVGKLVFKIFNKRWPIDQPRHCSHNLDDLLVYSTWIPTPLPRLPLRLRLFHASARARASTLFLFFISRLVFSLAAPKMFEAISMIFRSKLRTFKM